MVVRAGTRNRRITIFERTSTNDSNGSPQNVDRDLFSCFASYAPIRIGNERRYGDEVMAQSQIAFTMLWRTDFAPDPDIHFIRYKGQEYDIFEVEEVGLNEAWKLLTKLFHAGASQP